MGPHLSHHLCPHNPDRGVPLDKSLWRGIEINRQVVLAVVSLKSLLLLPESVSFCSLLVGGRGTRQEDSCRDTPMTPYVPDHGVWVLTVADLDLPQSKP